MMVCVCWNLNSRETSPLSILMSVCVSDGSWAASPKLLHFFCSEEQRNSTIHARESFCVRACVCVHACPQLTYKRVHYLCQLTSCWPQHLTHPFICPLWGAGFVCVWCVPNPPLFLSSHSHLLCRLQREARLLRVTW